MEEITFDALALEVVRLAEERPDYVYPGDPSSGCSYVQEGPNSPPCLWGQAMLNLGVSESVLYREGSFIRIVLERVGILATPEQQRWATIVQQGQDNRRPWGEAVVSAGPCPFSDDV